MASAAKTPNLGLPQWVAGEKPERPDFNAALLAIDNKLAVFRSTLNLAAGTVGSLNLALPAGISATDIPVVTFAFASNYALSKVNIYNVYIVSGTLRFSALSDNSAIHYFNVVFLPSGGAI